MKIIKLVILLKILYSLIFCNNEYKILCESTECTNSLKIIKVRKIKNINLPWGIYSNISMEII